VWLAIDETTREIVGVYVGRRNRSAAQQFWKSLPPVYRQCAVVYTDFWEAYEGVIASKRHKSVGKESGKTSYIERFNCTLRQRVSRLVRKTLSFSKKLDNHIGALWMFIHHYNQSLSLPVWEYLSTLLAKPHRPVRQTQPIDTLLETLSGIAKL
jgi:insertion element IS1 protein InsB